MQTKAQTPQSSTATQPGGFCGRCGEQAGHPDSDACNRALTLEPPRYCPDCRRRMIVQILPAGWTATCSQHGRRQEFQP